MYATPWCWPSSTPRAYWPAPKARKGCWLRTVYREDGPGLWLLDMIRRAACGLPQVPGTSWQHYRDPVPEAVPAPPAAQAEVRPAPPKKKRRWLRRVLVLLVALQQRSGLVYEMLSAPLLIKLGTLSYGIYLWHYPVVRYLRAEFAWPVVVVAGLALSTALAALSFYTLERWAMRYRDNLSQKAL